jgi:hypothetical protein
LVLVFRALDQRASLHPTSIHFASVGAVHGAKVSIC